MWFPAKGRKGTPINLFGVLGYLLSSSVSCLTTISFLKLISLLAEAESFGEFRIVSLSFSEMGFDRDSNLTYSVSSLAYA